MRVVFLPAAEHDLSNLFEYINKKLHNPIAAQNIAKKILYMAQKLEDFPEMGASLKAIDVRLAGYRYLLADNYLIIYKQSDAAVQIVRVLYARSDYARLLAT